jgi:hypothetical protein
MGSFEEWANIIGSVLAYAGVDGFLANLDETRAVQDDDTQQWGAFFAAWWERLGAASVTVDDLCKRILSKDGLDNKVIPDPLLVNRDRGEGALSRSLGHHLSRLNGRVFEAHKLCEAGEHKKRKVRQWALRPVNEPNRVSITPTTPLNPAANPAQEIVQ